MGRLREVLRLSRTAVLALAGAAIAAAVAVFVLTRDSGLPDPDPVAVIPADARDPFAYDEARRADFERRAAAGHAHTLYAKSPGGVVESARRTAAFRAEVERAAPAAGVSPELLEAIVFLESAGRPGAVADPKLEGAVGLTQILAETGRNLLGMKVDTRASRRLTRRIGRAERAGNENRAARLRARRQRVDERFDPRKALEATGRYLTLARGSFGGREDFGVAAYHMGIGNLRSVIRDFGGAPRSYAEVFFATSPTERAAAWRRLSDLGDDSSTYLWRVYAAREIMREYREDSDALADKADLYTAKNSAEEVLHPEDDTETFDDPDDLEAAYRDGEVRSFPQAPRSLGLRRDAADGRAGPAAGARAAAVPRACGRTRTRWRPTPRGSRAGRGAAPAPSRSRARCATASTRTCWPAATPRPPRTTRFTPPATPSTCRAPTRRAPRRGRSSSRSTGSSRST